MTNKTKLPRWILEEGETTEEESSLSPSDRAALGEYVGEYAASRGRAPSLFTLEGGASSPAPAPAPASFPSPLPPGLPVPIPGGIEEPTLAAITIAAARDLEQSGDPEAFAGLEEAVRTFFSSGGTIGLPHIWGRRALPEELAILVGERAHARKTLLAIARALGKPFHAVTLSDLRAFSEREALRLPEIEREVSPLWEDALAQGEAAAEIQWEAWKKALGLADEAELAGLEAPPIPPLSQPPAPASSLFQIREGEGPRRALGDLATLIPSFTAGELAAFWLGYKIGKKESDQ